MTIVFMSWIGDDPTEHTSMDDALDLLSERAGDLSFAISVDDGNPTHYDADEMASMLDDLVVGRRREARFDNQDAMRRIG